MSKKSQELIIRLWNRGVDNCNWNTNTLKPWCREKEKESKVCIMRTTLTMLHVLGISRPCDDRSISPNWTSVPLSLRPALFFYAPGILWPCVAAIWSMMNCMQIWLLLDRTCNLFGFRPWCKGDIADSTQHTQNTKYKYDVDEEEGVMEDEAAVDNRFDAYHA